MCYFPKYQTKNGKLCVISCKICPGCKNDSSCSKNKISKYIDKYKNHSKLK